jgi:nitrite reductase/ring-hydroxylating ferredoxin subunit
LDFIRVGTLAEVPDGELRGFELPAGRVAVAHVDHRLHAVGDMCTADGGSLSEGVLRLDREPAVECACGEQFDVETGEPVEGGSGDPVPTFAVHEVDGWIEVGTLPGVRQ